MRNLCKTVLKKFDFEGDRSKWVVIDNSSSFWSGVQKKSSSNCPSTPAPPKQAPARQAPHIPLAQRNNCNACVNWPDGNNNQGIWDSKYNRCVTYVNGTGKFDFEGDRSKWVVINNSDSFWSGVQQNLHQIVRQLQHHQDQYHTHQYLDEHHNH